MTKYEVKTTSQFKKDYKLAMKRNLNTGLLKEIVELNDVLVLTLARTGTHSDLFSE